MGPLKKYLNDIIKSIILYNIISIIFWLDLNDLSIMQKSYVLHLRIQMKINISEYR